MLLLIQIPRAIMIDHYYAINQRAPMELSIHFLAEWLFCSASVSVAVLLGVIRLLYSSLAKSYAPTVNSHLKVPNAKRRG